MIYCFKTKRMYTIITLNTWKCDGDYEQRLKATVKEIRNYDPDILLLQESFQTSDNKFNTSLQISLETGLTSVSSLSRPKKRLLSNNYMDSFSNVSILSKFPILNSYILPLPTNAEDGGREAIMAELQLGNHQILVCSLHLSHLKNQDQLRHDQLMHILEHPQVNKTYDGILIGGDFNMEVSDEYLNMFTRDGHWLYNTFKASGEKEFYTLNTRGRKVKIDHILELRKSGPGITVNHSQIVFQEPCSQTGVKVSDHNGVLLNFSLCDE